MYIIFFVLLCIAVTVIVGLSAVFASKGDDPKTPAAGGTNHGAGST